MFQRRIHIYPANCILFVLIFREENLDKILVSNLALDSREVFAHKCSAILSDGKLQCTTLLGVTLFLVIAVTEVAALLLVQFLRVAILIDQSISWPLTTIEVCKNNNARSPASRNSFFCNKMYRQISSLPLSLLIIFSMLYCRSSALKTFTVFHGC
jgi:hypothetical protein